MATLCKRWADYCQCRKSELKKNSDDHDRYHQRRDSGGGCLCAFGTKLMRRKWEEEFRRPVGSADRRERDRIPSGIFMSPVFRVYTTGYNLA